MSGICQDFFVRLVFMQAKNFDTWNHKKKHIDALPYERFHFHEREIWWASLGLNVGDEQDGKNELFERPVLILKKFNNRVVWILPLTTQSKSGPYYYPLTNPGISKTSCVILSQMRLISTKRLQRRMGKVSFAQLSVLQNRLTQLLLNQNRSLLSEAPRGPSGHL